MTIDNAKQSTYEISLPEAAPREGLFTFAAGVQALTLIGISFVGGWIASEFISMPDVNKTVIFWAANLIFLLLELPLFKISFKMSAREICSLHLEDINEYESNILKPILKSSGLTVKNTLELAHGGQVIGLTAAREPVTLVLRGATIFVGR